MKKLYIFILIVVCSFFAKAQHTLTAAFNPLAGDIESYTYLDTAGLFLGSSGTGQTWNYTGITTMTWTPSSYTYVPMSSVPNNFMFPGATIANDDGFNNYTVFSNNSTKIEQMGTASPTASNSVLFSDPIKFYTLPFSYGSSSSDAFSINAATYTVTGNVTTTGDGTGTLQLPSGNYSNVLKIKYAVLETVMSGTYIATYTITQCVYYSALSKFPLLTVSSQTENASSVTTIYKNGQVNTPYATSISAQEKGNSFSVFPNPVCHGSLTISDPKTEINSVSINNLIGQNIKTIYFEDQKGIERKTIDVSELPKGIYYLQLNAKEAVRTQRIIIE